MRVPPGASRQCKIIQRILLNLREQRRDGIAVVEPGKLDRAEDVGLKGGASQPRGSARFSCEGGFAEKSTAPVPLDRSAEMQSEEGRVGDECGSKCRSRWSSRHYKKNHNKVSYS